MADEYLWDRSGETDPEIQRLEKLLVGFRYTEGESTRKPRGKAVFLLALAASVLICTVVAGKFFNLNPPLSAWRLSGRRLAEGQIVATDGSKRVRLEAESVGELDLEPDSRLQIIRSNKSQERFALRQGTVHAFIWAPPERFVVDTPSATSIDLGCKYTLQTKPDGSGLLTVEFGWVAFGARDRECFIPAGAACRTRPIVGPGIPYFEDSSEAFGAALVKYEETGGKEGLDQLLANARPRDALTLWHLLSRATGADRANVALRFVALVPGMDAAEVATASPHALDKAWDLLGLGETTWWRTWKRQW